MKQIAEIRAARHTLRTLRLCRPATTARSGDGTRPTGGAPGLWTGVGPVRNSCPPSNIRRLPRGLRVAG